MKYKLTVNGVSVIVHSSAEIHVEVTALPEPAKEGEYIEITVECLGNDAKVEQGRYTIIPSNN